MWQLDNWKCYLVLSFHLFVHVWSVQPRSIHLLFHTHIQARRMHPSCIWTSFICLILPFRAAGQHWISPQLPCSHIDFRSRLNYFGMRPITVHCISQSLTMSFPLSHTFLICCSNWAFLPTCICLFFMYFFLSVFRTLSEACIMCVWVSESERQSQGDREKEWVHIMNNAWCGFLVSETDGGDGELPPGSFFPHHIL